MKPLSFEGGYFVETFRSEILVDNDFLPEEYHRGVGKRPGVSGIPGSRSISSSILFIITSDCFSRLHRLPTEEIYSFYFGDPVCMLNITDGGALSFTMLGNDIEKGEKFHHLVPKNCWQASYLLEGGVFAMLGTVMSPGFEQSDFESGSLCRDRLLAEHPEYSSLLNKLI